MHRHPNTSHCAHYCTEQQILRDLHVLRQLEGWIDSTAQTPDKNSERPQDRFAFLQRFIGPKGAMEMQSVSR